LHIIYLTLITINYGNYVVFRDQCQLNYLSTHIRGCAKSSSFSELPFLLHEKFAVGKSRLPFPLSLYPVSLTPSHSPARTISVARALSLRGKNSVENNICAWRQNFFHVVAKLLWVWVYEYGYSCVQNNSILYILKKTFLIFSLSNKCLGIFE